MRGGSGTRDVSQKQEDGRVRSSSGALAAGLGLVEPLLRHARWCLLKREENLTPAQATKLKDLLTYNLRSVRAYLLREEFQRFWEYSSPEEAGHFLDSWCKRAMRSRLAPIKKVVGTLRAHRCCRSA